LADYFGADELRAQFLRMRENIARSAAQTPTHAEFIARHCAAPS